VPRDEFREMMELAVEVLRAFGGLLARGGYAAVRSTWDAVGDRIGERRTEESTDWRREGEGEGEAIGRKRK
jgi:hypothetical protein